MHFLPHLQGKLIYIISIILPIILFRFFKPLRHFFLSFFSFFLRHSPQITRRRHADASDRTLIWYAWWKSSTTLPGVIEPVVEVMIADATTSVPVSCTLSLSFSPRFRVSRVFTTNIWDTLRHFEAPFLWRLNSLHYGQLGAICIQL